MAVPVSNPASSHSAEPHYQPLVVVLAAASVGIVVDRFWPLPFGAWWAMAVGGLTTWTILARSARLTRISHQTGPIDNRVLSGADIPVCPACQHFGGRQECLPHRDEKCGLERRLERRLHLASATLLLAVVATAAAWHHCCWYLSADDDLGYFARHKAEPVCVEATAVKMPRRLPTPAFDPLQMMPPNEGSRLEVDLVAVRDGVNWRRASDRRAPPYTLAKNAPSTV